MYHLLLDQSRQIPNSGYLGGELSEASSAQLTGRCLDSRRVLLDVKIPVESLPLI